MYREEKIQMIENLFKEMVANELIKDKETEKLNKITKMLYSLNEGKKVNSEDLDDIFKEILEFRDIVSSKYIRLGISIESAE